MCQKFILASRDGDLSGGKLFHLGRGMVKEILLLCICHGLSVWANSRAPVHCGLGSRPCRHCLGWRCSLALLHQQTLAKHLLSIENLVSRRTRPRGRVMVR